MNYICNKCDMLKVEYITYNVTSTHHHSSIIHHYESTGDVLGDFKHQKHNHTKHFTSMYSILFQYSIEKTEEIKNNVDVSLKSLDHV